MLYKRIIIKSQINSESWDILPNKLINTALLSDESIIEQVNDEAF